MKLDHLHRETALDEPAERNTTAASVTPGVTVGRILGFVPAIGPLVTFPGNPSPDPLVARTMVPIEEKETGREVTLVFENGDLAKPIILGVLQLVTDAEGSTQTPATESFEVRLDGNRLLLSAKEEIVLECGQASITLTRAGKILLRGEYISSRSSGANRIKGGSVQIN